MAGANDLTKMVPGFDFLQGLISNATASMPVMGQWIAPTLNPDELGKRITELRTVQFWLEQNARLLATTIQALEVQRMTLTTLQTMNLPLADLTEALKIRLPTAPAPAPEAPPAPSQPPVTPAAIDPMQWWGALTQQFTELAAKAVQDTASAGAMAFAATAGPHTGAPDSGAEPEPPAPRRRAR
jgi:hypothetical protein